MFATRFWDHGRRHRAWTTAFAARHEVGHRRRDHGATKFGPPGWQDDPDWRGWWGEDPPFHTPTYVLTHRPRPALEMEGGTTFHFLDASPQPRRWPSPRRRPATSTSASAAARRRVRDFVAAGLVDQLHLVVVPIVLGRGTRLWDGLEALEDQLTTSRRSRRRAGSRTCRSRAAARLRQPPPRRFRAAPTAPVCSPALPSRPSRRRPVTSAAAGCGAAW